MANIGSICSPRFSDSSDIVATNLWLRNWAFKDGQSLS
jgi:hypothetical protein